MLDSVRWPSLFGNVKWNQFINTVLKELPEPDAMIAGYLELYDVDYFVTVDPHFLKPSCKKRLESCLSKAKILSPQEFTGEIEAILRHNI